MPAAEAPIPVPVIGALAERLGLESLGGLIADLLADDLCEGDIGEAHAGRDFDEGTVAIAELAHPARDDIDKDLDVFDLLGGFFDEVALHKW